jgi:hypothetical protein
MPAHRAHRRPLRNQPATFAPATIRGCFHETPQHPASAYPVDVESPSDAGEALRDQRDPKFPESRVLQRAYRPRATRPAEMPAFLFGSVFEPPTRIHFGTGWASVHGLKTGAPARR